jgi:predicted nuclease of predicted toxin-antitoxin system
MSDTIRFQADEHIPTAVIAGLQRRGIDVLSTPKAGLLGATDKVQLAVATQQQRVFVTQDDDFLSLHNQGVEHSGIVFVQSGKSIGYMVRGLHFIYQMMTAEAMHNHVEFL